MSVRTSPRIELLGEHPHLTPTVARWHWDEWGDAYPGDTLEGWTAQLAAKTRTDGMPCTWVAFIDDALVGAVGLELDGVEPRPALTPDLSGLYVLPTFRRQGIGAALVRACEAGARTFGVTRLYLHTSTAEALYGALGWETIDRVEFQGVQSAIMMKRL